MPQIFEIIVTPDGGASGEILMALVNALDLPQRTQSVVVADVECNGNRAWVQRPPFFSTLPAVLEYAQSVGQFDWATFFLFQQQPSDAEVNTEFDALFDAAEMTIRAVDSTYFYIYSPTQTDAVRIAEQFTSEFRSMPKDSVVHPF